MLTLFGTGLQTGDLSTFIHGIVSHLQIPPKVVCSCCPMTLMSRGNPSANGWSKSFYEEEHAVCSSQAMEDLSEAANQMEHAEVEVPLWSQT